MIKFKINTATHTAALSKAGQLTALMQRTGITYEQWINCLFETGCRFIERNVADEFSQNRLLKEETFGYWDWWMVIFINDDETLLQFHTVNSPEIYTIEKQRLISLMDTNSQFRYFLKANALL